MGRAGIEPATLGLKVPADRLNYRPRREYRERPLAVGALLATGTRDTEDLIVQAVG